MNVFQSTSAQKLSSNTTAVLPDSSHWQCKWAFHSFSGGLQRHCASYVNICGMFICGFWDHLRRSGQIPRGAEEGETVRELTALRSERRSCTSCFGKSQRGHQFVYMKETDHFAGWNFEVTAEGHSTCLFTLWNWICGGSGVKTLRLKVLHEEAKTGVKEHVLFLQKPPKIKRW